MVKVYISSPYTIGDRAINVKRQMDVFNELVVLGYCPYAPLLSHFQHLVHPLAYDKWIELDLEWIKVCDVLLRLHGESKGAELEEAYAEAHNKTIVYSIDSLQMIY